jgi:hypothetical protein
MNALRTEVIVAVLSCACVAEVGDDPERDIEYVAGWSCSGTVGRIANPARVYYTTSFGCWTDSSGGEHGDPGDNCIPYCSGRAGYDELCGGLSGRDCELSVNWYAANSDRFGCMTRLKLTNPDNGLAAVVVVLDRGPACFVERRVSHWVLDVSVPTSQYLFGGQTSATERADVVVEVVDGDTPLGPVADGDPSDPAPEELDAIPCSVEGEEGECIDTNAISCSGTLHTGFCPGPAAVRCCTP